MIPRWLHRSYARLFGYFWLPCPQCDRDFGGHEVVIGYSVAIDGGPHRTWCPRCTNVRAVRDAIACGYRFGMDIMRVTGLRSAKAYPILARLEREGLIVSAFETDVVGRPPRRYYRSTEGADRG